MSSPARERVAETRGGSSRAVLQGPRGLCNVGQGESRFEALVLAGVCSHTAKSIRELSTTAQTSHLFNSAVLPFIKQQ